jgi:hypothetical protein
MRMPGRPCQHGPRDGEIIVLPWQAFIDYSTITELGLERLELCESASAVWSISRSHQVGLQFAVQKFKQKGPANGVDRHGAVVHSAKLRIHAIAIPANLEADHAPPKSRVQNLGIWRISAEVSDNETIALVPAINHR